jgi:hypothetical protein
MVGHRLCLGMFFNEGFILHLGYNNYLALRLRRQGWGGKEKAVIAKMGSQVFFPICFITNCRFY